MSYPMDLDDYSDDRLYGELIRRREMRLDGKCDYCRRPLKEEPVCSRPDRHNTNDKEIWWLK